MNDISLQKNIIKYCDDNYLSTFSARDFIIFGKIASINRALNRLHLKNRVCSICSGIYFREINSNEQIDSDKLNIHEVAQAMSRSNNWIIAPCDETVLYLMGYLKETPKIITYVTTGTSRGYKIGDKTLSFKHASTNVLFSASKESLWLIQTLKYFGADNIPKDLKNLIASKYVQEEKIEILKSAKKSYSWIYEELRKIFNISYKQY